MLKILRDNLKYLSWILWVVIIVFVLFVFVDFGGTVGMGAAAGDAAATVGDDKVSWGEFQRKVRQLEDQMRQTYGDSFTPELAKQMRLPLVAMNQLVGQHILLAEAERMELAASDAEVRRAVLEIPAFKDAAGKFIGKDLYADILRANGYSVGDFEQAVRTDLVLDKLRAVLRESVYVSDAEAERAWRERTEQATIRYLQQRVDQLPAEPTEPPSDTDLRAYYEAHKAELELPEQRVVAYALVDSNAIRKGIAVDDAAIASYYETNREQYRREEEVRARHILWKTDARSAEQAEAEALAARRRIEAGEDFAKLAAELSEDDSNKSRGGDLGYFGRGRMVKAFEDAAFGAAPGELVGPVATDFGYHLIQVLDQRPAGYRELAEATAEIRARLLSERTAQATEAKAKAVAAKAKAENAKTQEDLQKLFADDTEVTVEVTPSFGRTDVVPTIGRAGTFANAAFELALGGVSEPVRVARGWAVLLLTRIDPPRLPELQEVTAQVRAALEKERQLERARTRLAAARAAIEGGKDMVAVAAELGLDIQESDSFGATGVVRGLGVQRELARQALTLEEGQLGGPIQVNPQALVVFQVTARTRFDAAAFAREKATTRDGVQRERVESLLQALVDKRRREWNVTFDPRLVEQFDLVEPTAG